METSCQESWRRRRGRFTVKRVNTEGTEEHAAGFARNPLVKLRPVSRWVNGISIGCHSTSGGADATPFGVEDRRMPRPQGSELCSQPWAIRRNSFGVEDGSYETAGLLERINWTCVR